MVVHFEGDPVVISFNILLVEAVQTCSSFSSSRRRATEAAAESDAGPTEHYMSY